MAGFTDRLLRAAKLDVTVYEEVEADKEAISQAMGVVVLSSVAAGIGTGLAAGFVSIIAGVIVSLLAWYVWAYLTYIIGTKVLPEPRTHADIGQLLRSTGFSSSPGLIRIVGVFPGLTDLAFLVAGIWMLIAMVVAVRQALDYTSTLRAVGVCLIGWVVQSIILAVFLALASPPRSGIVL
ncbi:MAG: YIP1 family protein [Deltaproteobacteria bacterium]|nr:YIP1 family protein [Deltaproteobacteria bacterium]